MSKELAVILINYKRVYDTIECIESLQSSTFANFDIILIDNGSDDGSAEILQNKFPQIISFPNDTNVGFAEGNNIGIRYALEKMYKYILILNNDTVVANDALAYLMNTIKSNSKFGVVGCKILYYDNPEYIWFAGGNFNYNSSKGYHYGIKEKDIGQYDHEYETDYITGCCLLTRREVFEKIGMLDPDYFAYLEDVDFCSRAKKTGYSIVYQPKAVIYHKVSSTSSWDSPVYLYFNMRNKILFLSKNSRFTKWVIYLPYLIWFYLRQFIRLIFKHRNFKTAYAVYLGICDGLRKYTGKFGEGSLNKLK